jgi:hypothetical protein
VAKKFGEGVSDAQQRLARRFEQAGLCSYSQAMKAFQRRENDRIEVWKRQLEEKQGSA